MASYKAQLDITKLGDIIKKHPQLIREVQFKDGTTHKFVNIDINERRQPNDRGSTHYIKPNLWKLQPYEGYNYFIADVYVNDFGKSGHGEAQQAVPEAPPTDGLPF